MHTRHRDLIAVTALALLAVACVLLGAPGADVAIVRGVGIIAGALLVFVLPGYALAVAMLAGRSPGRAELALVSVGGSVALATATGLLLNLTAWGLHPASWTIALSAIVVECALVAGWQQSSVAETRPPATRWTAREQGHAPRAAILYGLASLVVVLAIWVASSGASGSTMPHSTRLWAVPASTGGVGVQFGVESHEATTTHYVLRIGSGSTLVGEWPDIVLGPGERWETSLSLAAVPSEDRAVEALLYRDDDPDVPYRTVTIAVR